MSETTETEVAQKPKRLRAVGTPETELPELDEMTRERIEVWKDVRRRRRETKATPSEENDAAFASVGTDILVDYLDARLSDPSGIARDTHVHPELKACALAVLNRLSQPRLYEKEALVGGRTQVVEKYMIGEPFTIKRHDGSRYSLYIHDVLIRLVPDQNVEANLVPAPRKGEIGLIELPKTMRDYAKGRISQSGDDLPEIH